MPTQLALCFDDVPVSCEVQQKYHAIAPCLAGQISPQKQARILDISYHKVTRWIREFRDKGLPGLFPTSEFPREPYTPERVIVTLVYFKCCAPKASCFELARYWKRDRIQASSLHSQDFTRAFFLLAIPGVPSTYSLSYPE